MQPIFIDELRAPLQNYAERAIENEQVKSQELSDGWYEIVFEPDTLIENVILTDMRAYYKPDESLCVYLSSRHEEPEIYVFSTRQYKRSERDQAENFRYTMHDVLHGRLNDSSPLPSSIQRVQTLPGARGEVPHNFYLVSNNDQRRLYFYDQETLCFHEITPHYDSVAEPFQKNLKVLDNALQEDSSSETVQQLLTTLLGFTSHHRILETYNCIWPNASHLGVVKKVKHEGPSDSDAADDDYLVPEERLPYFQKQASRALERLRAAERAREEAQDPNVIEEHVFRVHLARHSSFTTGHYQALTRAIPVLQRQFPAITDEVKSRMTAFFEARGKDFLPLRDAFKAHLASDAEQLYKLIDEKDVFMSYLQDLADWYYSDQALNTALACCDLIIQDGAHDEGETLRKVMTLKSNILRDPRLPLDEHSRLRELSTLMLRRACDDRREETRREALETLQAFCGMTIGADLDAATKSYSTFLIPTIMALATQLREAKGEQSSEHVSKMLRLSITEGAEAPAAAAQQDSGIAPPLNQACPMFK